MYLYVKGTGTFDELDRSVDRDGSNNIKNSGAQKNSTHLDMDGIVMGDG